ncbi:glutamyl-tRNA reductase [Loigolactobacillus binensis]|uniref:Glutamyl-tRNA reductase n=1 Tax=Loigolactobacillus binensis TaxID=2559922 RepID=A0ABW3ECD8_9LACO|nr:glutamyl-tRNA reductase [Loigolactobacillus binensis]
MYIIYLNLDYQRLPLALREQFTFTTQELVQADQQLNQEKSVLENVILSTCNRTEIYAVVDQLHTGRYYLKRFLANWFNVELATINTYVKFEEQAAAVTHLFRVASGLESLLVGEAQILGQVKRAFFTAQANGTTGAIFNHLFQAVITFAKRMHATYKISEHSTSASQAGLHRIKTHLQSLTNKQLVIVGLGVMGRQVLDNAYSMGFSRIILVNRTLSKAQNIASKFGRQVSAVPWSHLTAVLAHADAVITATAATQPIIVQQTLSSFQADLILIDLGVPRNIKLSTSLATILPCYDIDQLTTIVQANDGLRQQLVQKINLAIPAAVQAYYLWQQQLHIVPVIKELRESALDIQATALASLQRKLPELDEHELKVIRKHMKSIVNQMIKQPIKTVKELSVTAAAESDIAFFEQIFGLTGAEKVVNKEVG